MRYLILGALLGLLLAFPTLTTAALGVVTPALSQPLLVAFAVGLTAGLRIHRIKGAR